MTGISRGAPGALPSAGEADATAPEARQPATLPPRRVAVDPCLDALDVVIAAGQALAIDTAPAESVAASAAQRLGYPSDAYVVALVGGTGVGKSSLLNALAGEPLSAVSVRRPTTSRPVAWLPPGRTSELAGLLEWLGVEPADVRTAEVPGLRDLAILDLPDLDSTSEAHRRRVEAVLPRVDAVVWVTDPEKYADSVLHDQFLRAWLPRLDRQLVVLNKVDRLAPADVERVRRDLARDLARLGNGASGPNPPAVVGASARLAGAGGAGDGDGRGVGAVRSWLGAGVEAKAVVRARLRASIRDAVRSIAASAGLSDAIREPGTGGARGAAPQPVGSVLDDVARRRALDGATAALLRVVDVDELERQAVAAVRARARARGAGPMGGLTSRLYRWSGREARVADPLGFLVRWRDRGSLAPAVEPVRAVMAEPIRTAPSSIRGRLSRAFDPAAIEQGLARAVDRAVATREEPVPASAMWPALGLLQTLVTLGLVATVVWVALWVLVKFPVDSVSLPLVGRAPAPLVALLALLAAGYVLARLLGAHAGWVGRRWARRLAGDVRLNVARDVAGTVFEEIDAIDADRRRLAEAIAATRLACAPG